jgi:two-component system nitrogen regulation response regulator NtrX
MASLRQSLEKVAPTNSRILIQGECGTGKETLAREVHRRSKCAQGPFVVVSCANLRPSSFEEELFGVEKTQEGLCKIGFLEQAHGGTLFLSAVHDMPLETQGKILRVLHEHPFQRLGGGQPVHVDLRLIASTSVDLQEAVRKGTFRQDLYYRLNVVSLRSPALRERGEDISRLATFFLNKLAAGLEVGEKKWTGESLAAMQAYRWPGNIRELKNVVERALIFAPPHLETLGLDVLPGEIQGLVPPTVDGAEKNQEILSLPLKEARECFERQYLFAQVNRFSGNISRTASFVGMERSALHRKIRELKVKTERSRMALDT